MAKTLGGVIFCIDAIKFDYCIEESIQCLKELCDQVVVLDAGSNDGTVELLKKYEDDKTTIVFLDRAEWDSIHGKEKLAHFQNKALSFLETDWYFLLQADEIVSEGSFRFIREAIEDHRNQSYLCSRINLWGDCNHYINVQIGQQPCSTVVNRLARVDKKSYGDGESIDAIASVFYENKIKIVHYGFVRKKEVMKAKVMNMQDGVFEIPHDPKLDRSDVFDSTMWFSGDQLSKIYFKHPKWIREWAEARP
jgi:glycosyltransferase involved in cell wall biosynthesis